MKIKYSTTTDFYENDINVIVHRNYKDDTKLITFRDKNKPKKEQIVVQVVHSLNSEQNEAILKVCEHPWNVEILSNEINITNCTFAEFGMWSYSL